MSFLSDIDSIFRCEVTTFSLNAQIFSWKIACLGGNLFYFACSCNLSSTNRNGCTADKIIAKNLYISPLFLGRSGTFMVKKRYFSGRKVPLFSSKSTAFSLSICKSLNINLLQRRQKYCEKSLHFSRFYPCEFVEFTFM